MARPKKANTEESAVHRIENAFWKLIETESYSDITVLRISQESGTNRNSFYYHYRDIDDLAYQAFRRNADREVSGALLTTLLASMQKEGQSADGVFDPTILPSTKRIMLCAGSDSVFLRHMVRDLLKERWLEMLSIAEDRLTPLERLQMDFIFSGLTDVLSHPEVMASPQTMFRLSQTDLGIAMITAMKSISAKQDRDAVF